MHKRTLTTVGFIIAIALVLTIPTACSSGSAVQSGSREPIQGSSSGEPSPPSSGATTAVPPGAPGEGSSPSVTEESLSISIPAGVVLQHGDLVVSGKGFQPGEAVSVSARMNGSESTRLIARIVADDQGVISDSISVPTPDWLTSGIHTLVAKGEKSGLEAEAPLYVRADKLWIEIGNYGVRPTDTLGFVAGGFEPGEKIYVLLESLPNSPLAELTADEAGNIPWTEVRVPVIQGGDQTLILRGDSSQEEVTALLSVVPLTPWIELVPYAGLPGSQVKVHGRGFVPGETIHITYGQNGESSTFVADEFGNFFDQALTTIPLDSRGGPLRVQATGEQSGVVVSEDFNVLPLDPWVGLDNYAGPPGTVVRFRGLGFAVGERVTIHLADPSSPPIASGQTDSEGEFGWIGMATVPIDSTKNVTFHAVGESSHAKASVTFSVIIIPTPAPPAPLQPPLLP